MVVSLQYKTLIAVVLTTVALTLVPLQATATHGQRGVVYYSNDGSQLWVLERKGHDPNVWLARGTSGVSSNECTVSGTIETGITGTCFTAGASGGPTLTGNFPTFTGCQTGDGTIATQQVPGGIRIPSGLDKKSVSVNGKAGSFFVLC